MPKGRRKQHQNGSSKKSSKLKRKGERRVVGDHELKCLNEQLSREGLKLHDVPGDGNCLFRALVDQLWLTTGEHQRHDRLRSSLIQYMREHPDTFEPFMEEDELSYEEYLDTLSKDGEFGGNDIIVAASRYYNCTVIIHQPSAPRLEVHSPAGASNNILHIAYLYGEHYSSVRPLQDGATPLPAVRTSTSATAKKEKKILEVSKVVRPMESCGDISGMYGMNDELEVLLQTTGCQDKELAEAVLQENAYDAHTAIIELLQLMELTDNKKEGGEDGLEKGTKDHSTSDIIVERGDKECTQTKTEDIEKSDYIEKGDEEAVKTKNSIRLKLKPDICPGDTKPHDCPPPLTKRHLSNRERKELARKERKERRREEKKKDTKENKPFDSKTSQTSIVSLKI